MLALLSASYRTSSLSTSDTILFIMSGLCFRNRSQGEPRSSICRPQAALKLHGPCSGYLLRPPMEGLQGDSVTQNILAKARVEICKHRRSCKEKDTQPRNQEKPDSSMARGHRASAEHERWIVRSAWEALPRPNPRRPHNRNTSRLGISRRHVDE